MNIEFLSEIRSFIEKLSAPSEQMKIFNPLTLRPVEIASVTEKLQGIYDAPAHNSDDNTVLIGSNITLIDVIDHSEMMISIVLPHDSDPSQGKISVLSPLGSTLIGAKKGETVTIFVGNRMSRFRVASTR